jgi:purine-binding chemotaxis protein CheW
MSAFTSPESDALHRATNGAIAASSSGTEYLSFRLAGEEYGIDILKVQELRGFEAPRRIAVAAESVLGVVNLRGDSVPIVDLRVHFGLDPVLGFRQIPSCST